MPKKFTINLYDPSEKLLGLIEDIKNVSGFWGSETGNASIGQVIQYILTDYMKSNIRRCKNCSKPIAFKSQPHSEKRIDCHACGFTNEKLQRN